VIKYTTIMPKDKKTTKTQRPPIVVVMGHIDHGKTTLLDFIRINKVEGAGKDKSRPVTEQESGGITQHVGAYEVIAKNKEGKEKTITFIDTPGHEAFSQIRSRGAKIADVAILVIAADDGVKKQTEEALAAIKEAEIPFIVAINKMDKENADTEKVKKELTERQVFLENWGGKVPGIDISAKTGQGIDELLEMILLVSELEDLKTDTDLPATGYVLESHIDKKRGMAATLIIQDGTLKQGMCIAAKDAVSPVRIFEDYLNNSIKEATASSPIHIVGFNKLPEAGAQFQSFKSKKEAEKSGAATCEKILEKPLEEIKEEETEEEKEKAIIPIIIKADVLGSVEALKEQIKKLEEEKIAINILRAEVGDVNEDDVKHASSGKNAIILGFRVKCPDCNNLLAERFDVQVKIFEIIYELEKWLKEEIEKRRPVESEESVLGTVKILKIFNVEKNKKVVGGEVTSGKIVTDKEVKILRRDFEIGRGKILELRKFQEKIQETGEGEQIGIRIQTKSDIAPKDTLEVLEGDIKEVK
jgi:translation initiation factor IF-2